jgi:hypothetical protein
MGIQKGDGPRWADYSLSLRLAFSLFQAEALRERFAFYIIHLMVESIKQNNHLAAPPTGSSFH